MINQIKLQQVKNDLIRISEIRDSYFRQQSTIKWVKDNITEYTFRKSITLDTPMDAIKSELGRGLLNFLEEKGILKMYPIPELHPKIKSYQISIVAVKVESKNEF